MGEHSFSWQSLLPEPIIGVDEVGRGCLAGPVYAAAVILCGKIDERYTDSKLLSEKRRQELSDHIGAHHKVSVAFATVAEIDRLNILQASLLAMKRAIAGLKVTEGHVLVDGNQKIPGLPAAFVQTSLVGGDRLAKPISAASIVAKVARDLFMTRLDETYPHYGFASHKGYSTAHHLQAITEHGPCPEHRRSFRPIKDLIAPLQGRLL